MLLWFNDDVTTRSADDKRNTVECTIFTAFRLLHSLTQPHQAVQVGTGQRAVMPCGWGKAGMVVCGWQVKLCKTFSGNRSFQARNCVIPLLHTAISERFRGAARRSAIQIYVYFTLLVIIKLYVRLSVCPSVRQIRALGQHEST